MDDIGSRIREERERLGLSQEAFGALAGVKKLAQFNYEKGKRSPTGDYFEQLRQHKGIDVNYIVTGMRTGPEWDDALAHRYVLVSMASAIGIQMTDLAHVCDLALLHEKQSRLGEEVNPGEVSEMVYKLVASSTGSTDIDSGLLSSILKDLEASLEKARSSLPPEKKARAVVMLYRAFKASGKVDMKMIEDAVQLAASS